VASFSLLWISNYGGSWYSPYSQNFIFFRGKREGKYTENSAMDIAILNPRSLAQKSSPLPVFIRLLVRMNYTFQAHS